MRSHPVIGKDEFSFGVEAHQTCDYKKMVIVLAKNKKNCKNF